MALYDKSLSTLFSSLLLSCVCLISLGEATKNNGLTVDFIHRDSHLSPLYNPSDTRFERLRSSFSRSFLRRSSLALTSLRLTSQSPVSIQTNLTPVVGEFLMNIRIGTPPVEIMAIADTGSDKTWTQCSPCTMCFKQKAPLFDPTKSKTYRAIPCRSQQCPHFGGQTDCETFNICHYTVDYGDSSHTEGDLATETFTFGSTTGENVSFPNVVFGCGYENFGTFNGSESGLVGLGGGSSSIVKQLDKYIRGKFSYCLTSLDSGASSKISFGDSAIVTGPKVVSTPLVKKITDTFYFITLEAISVGNKRLGYQDSILRSNSKAEEDEGNIIIDSGTTLTFLPGAMYEELKSTLMKVIKGNRVLDPKGQLDLCYKLSRNEKLNVPPIVAHFKGADVVLPRGTTFMEVDKTRVVCLTILPSQDLPILGNLHQINYLIGYDLENQKLNFLPTDCTKYQ